MSLIHILNKMLKILNIKGLKDQGLLPKPKLGNQDTLLRTKPTPNLILLNPSKIVLSIPPTKHHQLSLIITIPINQNIIG